jgi:hypothetical protein
MMHRYSIRYWLVLSVLISTFLGSCTKEELDIYKRPETLEPPIYQVLSKRGNFKTLLGVIDKSGYQRTLSSAGYWTFLLQMMTPSISILPLRVKASTLWIQPKPVKLFRAYWYLMLLTKTA